MHLRGKFVLSHTEVDVGYLWREDARENNVRGAKDMGQKMRRNSFCVPLISRRAAEGGRKGFASHNEGGKPQFIG